jgi:hypothetical protein
MSDCYRVNMIRFTLTRIGILGYLCRIIFLINMDWLVYIDVIPNASENMIPATTNLCRKCMHCDVVVFFTYYFT